MKTYKIMVPHNALFQFWIDEDKLWHVYDMARSPDHIHPKYNTRSEKHHETIWKWDSKDHCSYERTHHPDMITACGFYLIDYNLDEMKSFVDWCIKFMNERNPNYMSPKSEGGKGYHLIFAYRSFGDKLEITYFVHPNPTNTLMDWAA